MGRGRVCFVHDHFCIFGREDTIFDWDAVRVTSQWGRGRVCFLYDHFCISPGPLSFGPATDSHSRARAFKLRSSCSSPVRLGPGTGTRTHRGLVTVPPPAEGPIMDGQSSRFKFKFRR